MSALKTKVFNDLFVKFIQEPKKKSDIKEEVAIPSGTVRTIHGRIIPQNEAVMVLKKGKLIGWDTL